MVGEIVKELNGGRNRQGTQSLSVCFHSFVSTLTNLEFLYKSRVSVNFPIPLAEVITFLLTGLIPMDETTPNSE